MGNRAKAMTGKGKAIFLSVYHNYPNLDITLIILS